jgi:NTE family protein
MRRRVLLDTTRLAAFLDDILGGRGFDALPRTFAAVACELTTGATVVVRDGPVASAVPASAAIPACSRRLNATGCCSSIGGLVDLVPAALARLLGVDIVVAVDVSGPLPPARQVPSCRSWWPPAPLQPGVAERLARDADLVLAPVVDVYEFWELSRIPGFEQAGRTAADQALPLLRALIAAAQARRDWQQPAAGSPATCEASRAVTACATG